MLAAGGDKASSSLKEPAEAGEGGALTLLTAEPRAKPCDGAPSPKVAWEQSDCISGGRDEGVGRRGGVGGRRAAVI